MKVSLKVNQLMAAVRKSRIVRLNLMGLGLALCASEAFAQQSGLTLPMGDFFCQIAGAMQSQWAPGIILICIIVEAFLFLVVKKGVMQMLMVVVLSATLAFSAGSLLHIIHPSASCSAVS